MDGTPISYNGFDMQTANVITSEIGDTTSFERILGVYNILRRAGAKITDDTDTVKIIPVSGGLESTNTATLEQLIDSFNAAMTGVEANLDIGWGGGTRRWIATPQKPEAPRIVRDNWAEFKVDFLITQYGKDTSATTLINNVFITTASSSQSITVGGSASEQYLYSTATINSRTGAAINTITIKNNDTGQAISITRAWTPGEVLTVDVELQKCRVNGTIVDFSGMFPKFKPGARTLVFSDDFTARNITLLTTQVKRWK